MRGGRFRVQFRRDLGPGYCDPELYVYGHRQLGVPIDPYEPDEVAVVEISTAAVVPGRYVTWGSMDCGVILVWTRRFVE